MSKTIIVTGGTCEMWGVLDLTLNSKINYCKQHNYDILIKRSFDEIPEYGFTKNDLGISYIGFVRVWECFRLLEQYDTVLWLDGDSIITNPNITIEDITDDKHTFFSSYDWLSYNGGPNGKNGFSTGNFAIRNTSMTNELFNNFYQMSRVFLHDVMCDQITLNTIYRQTNLTNCFKILDHEYLNSVPKCVEQTQTWLNDPNRTGPFAQNKIIKEWTESSFIAHLTGITNEEREMILKTNFKQYLN